MEWPPFLLNGIAMCQTGDVNYQLLKEGNHTMIKLTRIGVDLAKNVFQLHGADRTGKCVFKRRLSRNAWIKVLVEHATPGCEIGMEACSGAHHWARTLQGYGYTVKLIAP